VKLVSKAELAYPQTPITLKKLSFFREGQLFSF
jgi:hypothetical protein